MKKIALDFDSVLSDTMIAWTNKYNAEHNKEFTKETITSWSFWDQEEFGFDKSYADVFFRRSWVDWENLPSTEPNLDKKVAELSEFGQVDVVTNVDEDHLVYIRNWLENGNIEVEEVIHAGGEKIQLPYDLFIDDSPSLAIDAEQYKKKCFVYNQQWNIHIQTSENVSRIHSLTDAITEISEKGI